MAPTPGEPSAVDAYLRRRAARRRVLLVALTLLLSTVVVGNAWQQYRGGDDWARFDRRYFVVQSVMSGDQLAIESADGREAAIVHLLGVDAPDLPARGTPPGEPTMPGDSDPGEPQPHGALDAYRALRELAHARRVLLALPPLSPRAADGTLLAYVYLDGDDAETATSLNERLVADGRAYADRRTPHPTAKQLEQAEGEARRKGRGLWKDVRDDQQPAWRQQWLERLREKEPRPGR